MIAAELRGVIGDDELQAMLREQEERRQAAKAALGRRYLLHPDNQVRRKDAPMRSMPPVAMSSRIDTWRATFQ